MSCKNDNIVHITYSNLSTKYQPKLYCINSFPITRGGDHRGGFLYYCMLVAGPTDSSIINPVWFLFGSNLVRFVLSICMRRGKRFQIQRLH